MKKPKCHYSVIPLHVVKPEWTHCALGLYGGRPSFGVCGQCKHSKKRIQWWSFPKIRPFRPRFLHWLNGKCPCGLPEEERAKTVPIFRWAFADWYGWPYPLRWGKKKYAGCGCLARLKDWVGEVNYGG